MMFQFLLFDNTFSEIGDLIDSDKLHAMIIENIDLALDACEWLGIDDLERFRKIQENDWKWFDKNIRRFVLQEVVSYDL